MRNLTVVFGIVSMALASGCGKHSDSCKKSAELVAPFTDLGLPTEEGGGRVCEADSKKIKVEHLGKSPDEWRTKYEEAIVGSGYAKKDCSKTQCVYTKAKARLRVNVLEAKKWTTVIVEDYPEK